MNEENRRFASELDGLLRSDREYTEATAQLVDEAGFAINAKLRKMQSLETAMSECEAAERRLADRLLGTARTFRQPNPDPLGRDIGQMPRFVSRHAQQAPHTPPPIPAGSEFAAQDYDQPPRRAGRGF